ncbi:MAG: YHS domain-containing protein [Betaproteobacteria bacterium]|nr:YHS domain-containing protein [Betaproteobacteria bacterium]
MRAIVLIAAAFLSQAAFAQKPQIFSDRHGAIRGYDAVAYFTQGAPVKGSEKFSHQWRGATWYFASAENRDKFAAGPEQYAPHYGGYCAYAVAQGYTAEIDPAAWSVVEGKLYLNYNLSIRERWRKDIPGYIRKADANWPAVLQR